MTTDPEQSVVVEELAEVRRRLDVGLAHIEGRLAVQTLRDDQNDKELADLIVRVSALEHSRWPLPAVAALTAIGALAVTVWQALGR
ncbi:hypothetical protein [Streptomyces candidus]|uniref:Ethanolamine utilization microcompartment shell protein EutL n=1 Tax=Streptomyces candidus TaxID=67283 RepID=A0A7X0HH82_9ACTN|nr:hypothetical protein [Streptomyces candidus]MBB6436384.1 ethanolamine utilization microcompartment shell protein EutL [Streptomyces candidus]GHH48726.1 hypothetical protein GCM10018773_43280 [Streptomyces candidus]